MFTYLSIVPYWNWNGKPIEKLEGGMGSQSYHTGIEIVLVFPISYTLQPLNRTILELK